MEATTEFVSFADAGQETLPVLDRALVLLRTLASTAVEDAGSWGFAEAAAFAGEVEDLSRTVEYLQLVAAGAVDRTRNLAAATAPTATSWTTGWRDNPNTSPAGGPAGASRADAGATGASVAAPFTAAGAGGSGGAGVVDDGCRNTTEFLRARLRISAAEGRRRLCLAGSVLPRPGLTGRRPLPPVRAELEGVRLIV